MVVRKFKPLMIEAVVRGYIIGSGWKDYQKTGMVCGIKLPAGLKEAAKAARGDIHTGHQGAGRAARREHLLRRGGEDRRRRARGEGARGIDTALQRSCGVRENQGHHHRRH